MTGPYGRAAQEYYVAGWSCPLPVGVTATGEPFVPTGYSGEAGKLVSWPDLQAWLSGPEADWNLGLRMAGAIGVDVDAYDGKVGEATFAAMVEGLGPLPETWTSTSRGPGQPSRIHVFRVDGVPRFQNAEHNVTTTYGRHVEILHFGHRFAFAAPSISRKTGLPYVWYRPDGTASVEVPRRADLPELPAAWDAFLAGAKKATPAPVQDDFWDEVAGRPSPWLDVAGALADGRHKGVVKLACALRGRGGWRADDALRYMQAVVWPQIDQTQGGEPYSPAEFESAIKDVFSRYPDGDAEAAGPGSEDVGPSRFALTLMRRSELAKLPAVEPLIAGVLSLRTASVLFGPTGAGKTFVALGWACCVGTGLAWLGHAVTQMPSAVHRRGGCVRARPSHHRV